MAGNFHDGQVKFHKSSRSLLSFRQLFASNFLKLPARLASAQKSKDPILFAIFTVCHSYGELHQVGIQIKREVTSQCAQCSPCEQLMFPQFARSVVLNTNDQTVK